MNLNLRQTKILEAIIIDYIATAEPVGSRTIAKKHDFGISSATIRNEMSDLEEMGLITQLHTSSGRVPSDLGYRIYVNSLMQYRPLTDDETVYLQRMIMNNIHHVDYLLQETAKAIANLTQYATIVFEPKEKKIVIKNIQLMPMDERCILVVWITDTKAVKNKIVMVQDPPDYNTLADLAKILNETLQNTAIQSINNKTVKILLEAFGQHARLVMPILGVFADALKEVGNIYTSGVNNFLVFPEFADRDKVQEIFKALDEIELLVNLFNQTLIDGVHVIIGTENQIKSLQNCSIISANFSLATAKALDDTQTATIGIIGPTRMDYQQAISIMNGLLANINTVLVALEL